MSKCNVCGNTTFHMENVEDIFHIDGQRVLVEDIPARVCNRCGDHTYAPEVAENIRRMVHGHKRPSRRERLDVFAYA